MLGSILLHVFLRWSHAECFFVPKGHQAAQDLFPAHAFDHNQAVAFDGVHGVQTAPEATPANAIDFSSGKCPSSSQTTASEAL